MLAALARPPKPDSKSAHGAAACWSSVQQPRLCRGSCRGARERRLPASEQLKTSIRRHSLMATPPAVATARKTLHLLRHGETEMNAFLGANLDGYEDPLM